MTGQEIIEKFELYVDDLSSLSTRQSVDLINKVRRKVEDYRPWEWLKTEYSGTASGTSLSLPADFKFIVSNFEEDFENEKVVFLGSNYRPVHLIPFSLRRRYRDVDGFFYIDSRNNNLVFTKAPASGEAVEFDYIYNTEDLTEATVDTWTPVFPERFHDVIVHGMVVEFAYLDNTPKGRSYADENQAEYNALIEAMSYENSMLYGGSSYGNL